MSAQPKLVEVKPPAVPLPLHINRKALRSVSVIVVMLLLGSFVLHYMISLKIQALKAENDALKLQTQNLELFADQKARLLRLEDLLFSNQQIKQHLGSNVPTFAQKVLELTTQYRQDGLTASMLLGLIEVESGFNPDAVSPANAYGLMQVMQSTATPYMRKRGYDFSVKLLQQPELNLEIGTDYLMDLHRMYVSRGLEKIDEWNVTFVTYQIGERVAFDAMKRKGSVYLDYLVQVRRTARKWEQLGF